MNRYRPPRIINDLSRFWQRPCRFCGAAVGMACVTRSGRPVTYLEQVHYSRIDRRVVKKPDEYQRRYPQAAATS